MKENINQRKHQLIEELAQCYINQENVSKRIDELKARITELQQLQAETEEKKDQEREVPPVPPVPFKKPPEKEKQIPEIEETESE